MDLGRFQLGDELSFPVRTENGSRVPTSPDAAPVLEIYSGSAKVLSGQKIERTDAAAAVSGLFQAKVYLGSAFAAGDYTCVVRWKISSYYGMAVRRFTILPGGDVTGHVTSLSGYERPHARFLINLRSSGELYRGKNPRT